MEGKMKVAVMLGIGKIVTAVVLYFYRLNKKAYHQVMKEIQERKEKNIQEVVQ